MAGQTRINGNLIDTGTDSEDIVSISAGDARYPQLDGPNTLSGDLTVDGAINANNALSVAGDITASGGSFTGNLSVILDELNKVVNALPKHVLPPLFAFPGAAAAYSLRYVNAIDTPVVRVRRSSDNTEQDFKPGEIEAGTLTSFVNEQNPLPSTKVADFDSGAAAAYSLRYVSDSYTGPVVRVRRDSDNTEQDFTPTEIEDGSLESFCGSGDGLVTTWYDQSGNGNDATQTTASDQPKIVDAGVLVTENGKASIEFNNDGNSLQKTGGITGNNPNISIFSAGHVFDYRDSGPNFHPIVTQGEPSADDFALYISGGNAVYAQVFSSNSQSVRVESPAPAEVLPVNSNFTLTALGQDNEQHIYTNGSEVSYIGDHLNDQSGFDASGSSDFIIGEAFNRTTFVRMFEIVIYPSFVFSNRVSIETDINSYYQIYEGDNEGHVTTWYDQSGNGNDATQTTASDQPKIVDAGVLVTENGRPALDFDGVDDFLESQHPPALNSTISLFVITRHDGSDRQTSINNYGTSSSDAHFKLDILTTDNYNLFIDEGSIGNSISVTGSRSVLNLVSALYIDEQTQQIFADGTGSSSSFSTNNLDLSERSLYIGKRRGDVEYQFGKIPEIILYPSDQSSNRELIETNINNHYGIY